MGNNITNLLKQVLKDPKSALRRYYLVEQKACLFDEVFVRQEYYWLVKNADDDSIVLDFGANLGDTAIYFAMFDKIKKEIAYEPLPMAYELAKKFIANNPFKNKIILYNKAVSNRRETKVISKSRLVDFGFSYLKTEDKLGTSIKAVALNDAVKGLRNVVIKCDIEGAEATIFNNANLSEVTAIELEYHNNLDQVLLGLEGKGFEIIIPKPKEKQGILYAKRI